MTPYFSEGGVSLYLGDAREIAPALDAYKFPPDRETYFLTRGGTEGHAPTCPRSQYAQAGRLGEDCGCEPADPLVEALRESVRRGGGS